MNQLSVADWWGLFGHFLMLSMLSIGGAIATVSDMHRYVVVQNNWMSDATFSSSIALAQAAPGPNLLFVPVIGFQIAGVMGAAVTLVGMLIPSTLLALTAVRWLDAHQHSRGVRAFVAGMMPITLALLMATGWVLARALPQSVSLMAFVAAAALLTWRAKVPPVLLVLSGAALGGLGLI
jgi:chromate transporter